ncbi:MAG: hypothetical protein WB779_00105, partial [Ignavibacteriaceae bacterium]
PMVCKSTPLIAIITSLQYNLIVSKSCSYSVKYSVKSNEFYINYEWIKNMIYQPACASWYIIYLKREQIHYFLI